MQELRLGLIDYGAGNLRSVYNTFVSLGVEVVFVRSASDMAGLTHLVLPGVGSFGDCADKIRSQGLAEPIAAWIAADRPFLGICVGYQVLFETSEETPDIPGLGIFKGRVVKFHFEDQAMKVPHMGWNSLECSDSSLWKNLGNHPYFYFVHSYYPEVDDESLVAATCTYGLSFAAAIQHGKLCATQFHPEKSQKLGALLLKNFLSLDPR